MRLILMFMLLIMTAHSFLYDPLSGKSIAQQRREQQFKRCMEVCVRDKNMAKPEDILCSECPLPINPAGMFLP